jgi:glycosyltransferase involved in cell wall biosynthesis
VRLTFPVTFSGDAGPAWGYRAVSGGLFQALTDAGVTWDPDAPVALHVAPPHVFTPLPGRRNVLLTMTEFDQVPPEHVAVVQCADLVLVPSRHSRTAFQWAGVRRPIRVVPLGLGVAHHVPVPPRPARPYRFLWVGQADVRKGPHVVNAAFAAAFADRADDVELVMKTVPHAGAAAGFTGATGRVRLIAEAYTDAEMAALYRSAHAFVFPTYGEGWGMPVLEALAAECLVLAPMHTGLLEFFDGRVGWPLPWSRVSADYGGPVSASAVDPGVLAGLMRTAVGLWRQTPTLGALGVRARERALRFTWGESARQVRAAIQSGILDMDPRAVVERVP